MMRKLFALLCFSLLFPTARAADPAPPSPTDTYILARDQAVARVCSLKDANEQDAAAVQAIAALKPLFATAVPPWKGLPVQGEFTLYALCRGSIEYGQLDGWVYRSADTTVTVTNLGYLKRWLVDHRDWWTRGANLPDAVPAAFHDEDFYTQAISTDAAASFFGDIPVQPPAQGIAVAKLVLFTNGDVPGENPDTIIAAVVRGDRVFIARQTVTVELIKPAICRKALDQSLAQSDAALKQYRESLKGKPPGKVKDISRFTDHVALEEGAGFDYRACFERRLRRQPNLAALQTQAQALVDLLH